MLVDANADFVAQMMTVALLRAQMMTVALLRAQQSHCQQSHCTNDDSGSVEFLDVNHCIAADSVFGFVTKDFVKPTSVGRRFIHDSSHHPPSNFKSIIFGEAIRLRRLNERKEDYLTS